MTPVDAPPQYLIERTVRVPAPTTPASQTLPSGPPVLTFNVAQPAASWLRSAVARIEALTRLPEDWDSYGAARVSALTATQAVRFLLDYAYPELAQPSIVPLPEGGVQIEWHRGGVDVEVAFSEADSGVYVEDAASGEGHTWPLADADEHLSRLLPRLAK